MAIEIIKNLYLGNFKDSLLFPCEAILNVAMEIPESKRKVEYLKIPLEDGINNPIGEKDLALAFRFVHLHLMQNEKVLVHCWAGIGRSASIMIGILSLEFPYIEFSKIVEYVRSKSPTIRLHIDLEQTIEEARKWLLQN